MQDLEYDSVHELLGIFLLINSAVYHWLMQFFELFFAGIMEPKKGLLLRLGDARPLG